MLASLERGAHLPAHMGHSKVCTIGTLQDATGKSSCRMYLSLGKACIIGFLLSSKRRGKLTGLCSAQNLWRAGRGGRWRPCRWKCPNSQSAFRHPLIRC